MLCNEDPRDQGCALRRVRAVGRQRLPAAGADLRRRDAHAAEGARRLAVAEGSQRDHARRTRRRRRHVAEQHARRMGDLAGLQRGAGARGQGVPRREHDRGRLRQNLGRSCCPRRPIRSRTMRPAKRRRRDGRAAFRTCSTGTDGTAGRIVLRAVAAQPVCRCVSRAVRGGARRSRCSSAHARRPTCSPSVSRPPTWSATPSARAATKCRTCSRTSIETIGVLFDALDAQVGKGRWVAALSSDHGVTPIPEQLVGRRQGRRADQRAARSSTPSTRRCCRRWARAATSRALSTNDLYFEPGVYDKVRRTPAAIERGDRGHCRASGHSARLPQRRRARRGEGQGSAAARRGAQLLSRPQRRFDHRDQTRLDDLRRRHDAWLAAPRRPARAAAVPRTGRQAWPYQQPATPADLAPTLAAIVGISFKAEGHPLF